MNSITRLVRKDSRLLFFGFVLMFCSSPGQTYFIALFGGQIRAELNLSHGEFGAVYSIATLASAVLLLWSASLLDRVNMRWFILPVVGGLACAAWSMSMASTVLALGLSVFLLRHLGQGLMSTTSSTSMMRYLSANKAKGNALANMGYSAAEIVLPSTVVLLLLTLSWREAWQVVSLVLVVIVLPLLMFLLRALPSWTERFERGLRDDMEQPLGQLNAKATKTHWQRHEVIRDPYFYLLVPALVSQSLLYTGFMFHQIHLVEEKGWSLTTWASLYVVFSTTTIVTSLSVGALADRVGAVRLAPFATVPMALGLMVLASSASPWVAPSFMFLMGCSTGSQAALSAPFFAERYGSKYFASIKSLASFIMVFTTAVSPIILGYFIDQGVGMNSLARWSALYALLVSLVAYLAYRRLNMR